MLRPQAARWFEVLAARDDATLVLEALARTGAVELEAREGAALPAAFADLRPGLVQFAELASRFQAYWPPASACRPSPFPEPPEAALQRSLEALRAWAREAEPLVRRLQGLDAESATLRLWQRVRPALAAAGFDGAAIAGAGPWLGLRLVVLPPGADAGRIAGGDGTLACALTLDDAPHLLLAGSADALREAERTAAALKGRVHVPPDWLGGDAEADVAEAGRRLARTVHERTEALAELERLADRHGLRRALGDAHRLQWVLRNVSALDSGDWLCWITGWTCDADGARLHAALAASGARALLHRPPAPAGRRPPLMLANPVWARPFEIFSRALGMPAADEADPSALLAVAVPLMFGYMFGDLGQGLVIAAVAWHWRRHAVGRLLVVGGLAAAAFGWVFGSVFALHGWLPALWLHPLDAPLAVLAAPLAGGALLLVLGLMLDALAAWWRHELVRWLLADGVLLVVYLALLSGAAFTPAAWAWAAAAALAGCAAAALSARRWGAAAQAAGELVEKTLQLLINTLSFARVGAFALAHAGLSSAIVALADAADAAAVKALVLLLGNALVIVIEAMVVSIQTTRLVLFEFFTRFMRAGGRAFRALPPPPFAV